MALRRRLLEESHHHRVHGLHRLHSDWLTLVTATATATTTTTVPAAPTDILVLRIIENEYFFQSLGMTVAAGIDLRCRMSVRFAVVTLPLQQRIYNLTLISAKLFECFMCIS